MSAVLIDLAFIALVLWLAIITSSSVLRDLDEAIRIHVYRQLPVLIPGDPPKIDLVVFRAQLAAHPLLAGRPFLSYLLTILGSAAMLIVVRRFIDDVCSGSTLGEYCVVTSPANNVILNRAAFEAEVEVRHSLTARALKALGIDKWHELLGSIVDLLSPLKTLPRDYRLMGLGAIAITVALGVATAIVLHQPPTLAQLSFVAPNGNTADIARLSLYLCLASIAVGWAIAIAGASLIHPMVLLPIALFYEFTTTSVGLTGGRAWWVVAPQWAMLLIAAFAPVTRTSRRPGIALVWVLALVAVFHTFRMTPLAMLKTNLWPTVKSWPAIFLYASAIAAAAARIKVALGARQVFVAVVLVTGSYFALSLRVGERPLAGSLYYSVSALEDFLILFWFLLGRNLVTPCVDAGKAAATQARRIFGPRQMPRVLIAACLIELALIAILQIFYPDVGRQSSKYVVAIPAHRNITLSLLALAAIMASLDALTLRRAMWLLAIWAFSLAMIIAYFGAGLLILNAEIAASITGQVQAQLGGIAKLSAMVLLSAGILLEVISGHKQFAADSPSDASVGLMLMYLGLLALFSVLTHLMLGSQTYQVLTAATYTFQGMSLMWPAIAAIAVLAALRQVTDAGRKAMSRALIAGAIASIIPDLIRRAWGNPAAIGIARQLIAISSGQLTIAACVATIVMLDDTLGAADSICTGLACAFGFVIAYVGELITPVLSMMIGVPAHMLGITPLIKLTEAWLTYLPYGDHGNPVPHADLMIFYLMVPALAAMTALGTWSLRHGTRSPRIAIVAAIAMIASLSWVIPLYWNPFLVAGFGRDLHSTAVSTGIAQDAYLKAALYLALPVLMIAWFVVSSTPRSRASGTPALTPGQGPR